MGIGGMVGGSEKGLLLYTDEVGCDCSGKAVLCVRLWFEVELVVMLESLNRLDAPSISSISEANGPRATKGITAGCGGVGPRDCSSVVSGLAICRYRGGSGVGSAKGSIPTLFRLINGDCEETLLVFLRSTFRSLFLLDMRRTKPPPAADRLCGSLIDLPRTFDVVEYTEPILGRGTCRW